MGFQLKLIVLFKSPTGCLLFYVPKYGPTFSMYYMFNRSIELGGLDWNISKNLEHEQMLIPEDSIMFKNPDDTYNLRFSGYKKKQTHDEEATTSGLEKFLEQ